MIRSVKKLLPNRSRAAWYSPMLLAISIAQVGYSISKRATTDRARFLRAAIAYSLAGLLILASIPWPFMKYGRPLFPSFGS